MQCNVLSTTTASMYVCIHAEHMYYYILQVSCASTYMLCNAQHMKGIMYLPTTNTMYCKMVIHNK